MFGSGHFVRTALVLVLVAGTAGAARADGAAGLIRSPDCEGAALANAMTLTGEREAPPQDLSALKENPPFREDSNAADVARLASVRQSAISLGMRAGFNRGIWCYQRQIERVSKRLDKTFNFGALLFQAGGGFLYEPGIVTEDMDDRAVKDDGKRAASASNRIVLAARENLVSRPRDWRQYLIVDIEALAPEHPANRPQSGDREQWEKWVAEGWRRGLQQATDTMDELWSRLDRDYVGMVTYKRLMLEGKLEKPKSYVAVRGVTGNEAELRVDDTEVQTTKPSGLQPNAGKWRANLPFLGHSE